MFTQTAYGKNRNFCSLPYIPLHKNAKLSVFVEWEIFFYLSVRCFLGLEEKGAKSELNFAVNMRLP